MKLITLAVIVGLAGASGWAQAATHADLIAHGRAVYDHWCGICHDAGPYMAGTQQLRINYHGTKPSLLTKRTDLTPAFVKAMVRRGYGVMPRFRKTEVSDADLAAVAAYLSRNNPALKGSK